MLTKDYRVTKKAGDWVAGQRSPGEGKILKLTSEQARYALLAKEIELVKADEAPAPTVADPAPSSAKRK